MVDPSSEKRPMPRTVLDSWRASLAPVAPANSSVRPSPRAPEARSSTVARRVVRPAENTSGADADFIIERLIGSGGMGMVYLAAQTSLNRTVAFKALADDQAQDAARQASLREEALIAGQLDHPNIVPVYDLATDEQGRLFYTMKQVRGRTWSGALPQQPLDERLGIFQRVCDAIAFAHSRGVIHRDLKPSNVMLGAFGEVTVMDWGVACTVRGPDDPRALGDRAALCGTPAYMPPEMARGEPAAVGFASDIYLLGAMLYELLEDRPLRGHTDALTCIEQAAENFIEPPRRDDELTRVAMRAMSERPGDRFAAVTDLQAAVRECVAHLESIRLARMAEDASHEGEATGAYPAHARAIFGFEQALERWPGNEAARAGMLRARMAYARNARAKGDYELALSQLDAREPSHARERAEIEAELAAHRQHRRRLRIFIRATAGLAATLALGAAAFGFIVHGKNVQLEDQQTEILNQKNEVTRRLQEVRRSDRASLVTVLRAQYAAGEHEAAVITALRLREEYGFDFNTDPDLRQMARVSAWMNPWRATMETGVEKPLRLILTADSPDLYVVAEREIARVDLQRMEVRERIPLPSPSVNPELVQVGAGGRLWCARGMDIFRHDGTNWVRIITLPAPYTYGPGIEISNIKAGIPLDLTKLTVKPAKPPVPQCTITGLLVSHGDQRLAVGIDGEWLACRDTDDSGAWQVTQMGEKWGRSPRSIADGEACLIRDSPDGRWLAWRPATSDSMALAVEANPLRVRGRFYNRSSRIFDVAVRSDPLQLVAATYHGTIFRPDIEVAIQQPQTYDAHSWRPECHGEWQTPLMDCEVAAWRPDGREVVTANAHGWIWTSSSHPQRGRRMLMRTRTVAPVSLALDAEGQVYVLTKTGAIRKYDARSFSPRPVPDDEPNPDQAPEDSPCAYAADRGGRWMACEPDATGRFVPRELKTPGDFRIHAVALDPRGEYTVHATHTDLWIFDRTNALQRIPISLSAQSPIAMEFTPDGERLVVRQLWISRFLLLRRSTWEPVKPSAGLYSVGLYIAPQAGRMKVFVGGNATVTSIDAATGATDWISPCGNGPIRNLIPVPAGVYADGPSVWANSYMGTCTRLSLAQGRVLQNDEYWNEKMSKINIKMTYGPNIPYTAILLPGRDGLVVAWNGDMRPITPDLLAGEDCAALSFSPRGSILIAHRQGYSLQFPMPRAADMPRISVLLRRLFGPDALDARLTAVKDTP